MVNNPSEALGNKDSAIEQSQGLVAPPEKMEITLETHKEIISIFQKDKLMGLSGLIQGDSLHPEAICDIWCVKENYELLKQYSSQTGYKEKIVFAKENPLLIQRVKETQKELKKYKAIEKAALNQGRVNEIWAEISSQIELDEEISIPSEIETQILAEITKIISITPDFEAQKEGIQTILYKTTKRAIEKHSVEQEDQSAEQEDQSAEQEDQSAEQEDQSAEHGAQLKAQEKTDTAEKVSYLDSIKEMHQEKPALERLGLLIAHATENGQEAVKTELEGYKKQLESLSEGLNETESVAMAEILGTTPLNIGAGTDYAVFGAVIEKIEDSEKLSTETKYRLSEKLGKTVKLKPKTTTGSDIIAAVQNGAVGLDANGEPIPVSKDNPLQVRPGIKAYPSEGDPGVMEVTVPYMSESYKIPMDITGEDLGKKINILVAKTVFEKSGMTGILGRGAESSQGTGVQDLDLSSSTAMKVQQVMTYLIGGFGTGGDGAILNEGDINDLEWACQWFGKEEVGGGNGGAGNVSKVKSTAELTELGILGKDGEFKEKEFIKAARFVQDQYGTGAPSYESLKGYLNPETEEAPTQFD